MTTAVVVLVIVALVLALAAGFGWGGLFVADRLHEDQRDIELRIRTLAQMEQVQAVGTWAAQEIARPSSALEQGQTSDPVGGEVAELPVQPRPCMAETNGGVVGRWADIWKRGS